MWLFIKSKFELVFAFFFYLSFANVYFGQSFIDNGFNLFQLNKNANYLNSENIDELCASKRMKFGNDFDYYSELYMCVLYYENINKPTEAIKISKFLFEEMRNERKIQRGKIF